MKQFKTNLGVLFALTLFLLGCKKENPNPENTISHLRIEDHVKTLASDKFLGRQPGTLGEPITIDYISSELKKLGIEPAIEDSYYQEFEITEIAPIPPENMVITDGERDILFKVKEDFIATTSKIDELVSIQDKELVFAGFGIVAPEYDWDDYQNLDVRDKVVIVLYNDPGLYTQDSTLFKGLTPTKYSTSSYKKEEAYKRGAAGVLTIFHDTGLNGLNWGLVQAMATRPTRYLNGQEPAVAESIPFSGMISIEMANTIIRESGHEFDYIEKALDKQFKPMALGLTVSVDVLSKKRTFKTNNVLGILKGRSRADEAIVYTAHWDHDGYIQNAGQKDSVYNGAIDNATGVAMVLETARAFKELKEKPDRSILFFLTSAEEMGLLGAKYYVDNPIIPMEKTVCVINADASHATEPMRVAVNVIKGHSNDMDSIVDAAAAKLDRVIIPDDAPQIGAFYRSDHYPFVEKGVPAVWAVGGGEPMAGDSIQQMQIIQDYMKRYHQLNDEYYDGFIAKNIAFDAKLNFLIGYQLSNSEEWPNWNEGTQYKAVRDESKR
jgi:hypothetical protein